MSTICQHLYTFGEEVYFTRMWDFTWRFSDCEGLVEDLFRGERGKGGNDLQRDNREMMRLVEL